ncbi:MULTISPECIES: hypothetical protein [unclassified Roseofilum]|uniref:hypothetical protein n=1 Tax=unclassified Roseofilum TaxID=2620099 RepID=UPI000E8A174C|nr:MULTISPECIES: hypothetical protein [unclassified Roseofilum]MBP0011028.1 hypothetical protein [Roseofilum sp. Belize Diploria]MBP0031688.1 hypothetical protein [Roseofilum sp. Belize BBD 4]HBR00138.1 hypothetical protein [Cyanobacteria bacterium UBA11691]
MKILDPNQSYTFSQIVDLNIDPQDLAEEFGYSLERLRLDLRQYSGELNLLEQTRSRIQQSLPHISLTTETSRRQVLVSPVLLDLVRYTKSCLRIEYPLRVKPLQGILDYLLRTESHLLVLEAKKEDVNRGFTQLMAKMIALDRWEKTPNQPILIGAVTTGFIWKFGRLDREQKHFQEGLDSYRVLEDIEPLLRILIHTLIP